MKVSRINHAIDALALFGAFVPIDLAWDSVEKREELEHQAKIRDELVKQHSEEDGSIKRTILDDILNKDINIEPLNLTKTQLEECLRKSKNPEHIGTIIYGIKPLLKDE